MDDSDGLLQRLKNGGTILCAEGFMLELERKGFVKFGEFTPDIILRNPEIVKMIHYEFARAGSDVCEAYTYLGSRHQLSKIGREYDTEELNRKSLKIARQVAKDTGSLMAGGISHTWTYKHGEDKCNSVVKEMFKEQIEWAVDEGVDYIIGETFESLGEALLGLEAIQQYGNGLPAVITLTAFIPDMTLDEIPIPEACERLEDAGAAVVGLNCAGGPETMLPLIKEIRKACKVCL